HIVNPPETLSTWPVIYLASSLAKKSTAPGKSLGTPIRPIGIALANAASSFSGSLAPSLNKSKSGVLVGPGQTTFTLIPSRACSRAIVFENPTTPALQAAYTASPDEPTLAASEAILIMLPPF